MRYDTISERFRHALVWGYGLEGQAACAALSRHCPGLDIRVADTDPGLADSLDGAYLAAGEMASFVRANAPVLLVKSPGISPYGEDFAALIAAGAVPTSQTNLWLANKPAHQVTIGVTGTKGKSTSSTMIAHILGRSGHAVALGGNVGRPVCTLDDSAGIVVVELSSYQGADLAHGLDHAVLLNLDADHIPWHRTLAAYQRDKLNILMQSADGQLTVPAEEAWRFGGVKTARPLALHGDPGGFWVDEAGTLRERGRALDVPAQVLGAHNRRNLAAALTVTAFFGVTADAALAALADFRPLAHRLETVRTLAGITYVDDAIATTPRACWSAVEAFAGHDLVLVLGGTEREQDYPWLAERLRTLDRLAHIVLIPDNGPRIAAVLDSHGLGGRFTLFDAFEPAIRAAPAHLPDGGVVLLSPAAPRGAEFGHINARGDRFREIVMSLPG